MDASRAPISPIVPGLLEAYRATHYCVSGIAQPFVLRIDVPSDDLGALHAEHGVEESAFLTAYNPHSVPTDEAVNEAAQVALAARLTGDGFRFLEGLGVDPTGDWPAEPSLLVLGLSRAQAAIIGSEFRQNGFVWSGADSIPRLVMLR